MGVRTRNFANFVGDQGKLETDALTKPRTGSISPSVIGIANTTQVTLTGSNYVAVPLVQAISNFNGRAHDAVAVSQTNSNTVVASFDISVANNYFIRVENPGGLAERSAVALLQVSQIPSFTTAAGSLGDVAAGEAANFTIVASSDSTVTFSETTSVLTATSDTPGTTMSLSLNSSTGAITGTLPSPGSQTTYTFTIRATDAEGQTADRQFSITVIPGIPDSGGFN